MAAQSGLAPHLLAHAGWSKSSVVNAGDGTHEHPTQALLDADLPLAESVIDADARIDILTSDIEERCLDLIAETHPAAEDLRQVIGALRIASSQAALGSGSTPEIAKKQACVTVLMRPASPACLAA